MPIPFSGAAVPLSDGDMEGAANRLKCTIEAVHAVCTVETGGVSGFLSDGSGRCSILFEAKRFGDATAHRFDTSHPLISTRVNNWKLYKGGTAEYERLNEAVALAHDAALESTSWGLFQVMGSNAEMVGYPSVSAFVDAMAASEGNQLEAFVSFVQRARLVEALQNRDWATFARGYNGPAYAVNQYDTRLAIAYAQACGRPHPAMVIGSQGEDVRAMQILLAAQGYLAPTSSAPDGILGRATELAVMRFQSAHGLHVDGIVGPSTFGAMFKASRA